MSTRGLIGTLAGIVLLLVAAYYAWPNPGKKALVAEAAAVNNVSSWRITTQISRNGALVVNRIHTAECPDKEYIVEQGPEGIAEYTRIGDDIYYRKGSMHWTKGTPSPDLFFPLPSPRPCLSNPGEPSSRPAGGAEEMRLLLESDIKDGHIEAGEKKDYKGSPCQEWSVTRFTERNQLGSYVTCVGTDSLPRYLRSANENFNIYFEWGVPVAIDAPDMNGTTSQLPSMR